ncbi:MAG: GNAT family N-acetyltransferase [Acetobacter sp.]|nr:GNAT family N-acetyltransferase [Acetobacter sp.]
MRLLSLKDITSIKPFDCGDADLNEFLLEDAKFYEEQCLAHTYILENENETIAFFSVLNDKVSQTEVDKSLWRKLRRTIPHEKHYDSYPAVKIGRLAVSSKYKGQDIGTTIIIAIRTKLGANTEYSACRFLTVDAYKEAKEFYTKNGFLPLLKEVPEDQPTIPMYFDLKAV